MKKINIIIIILLIIPFQLKAQKLQRQIGDNRQKWIIQQDSDKQIAGYPCQLGYCHFRGRTWKAWFTTDIPVSNGPWKLAGLPGLILEAYDSAYHYHYTLTEIRNKRARQIRLFILLICFLSFICSVGPWKLAGLPGLILEAYDSAYH